ncbi:GNAT family N-acetyltransferase [Lentilitoribacter sp. EG35]|uniref:GNAT family N-acetyltransferase n=1 Tax=Lentilitoribacter sp. EG35 TaxID=3234192 RepID=UPI00345FE5DD
MSDRDVFQPPERIETERLILRKAQASDAAILHDAYMTDPDVPKFMSWKPHTELSKSEWWIDHCIKQWEAGKNYEFVIEYKGKPMGMAGMHLMPPRVSFGYVIASAYWGRGIVPEALTMLINWALAQDKIYRAQIFCHVDNRNSQRVIEKCGLEYEGTLRRYFIHPNISSEPTDCKMYSKIRL